MGQLDGAAELARLGEAYFATQHSYDPYNATLLGVAEFDELSFDPSREASERAARSTPPASPTTSASTTGYSPPSSKEPARTPSTRSGPPTRRRRATSAGRG